MRRQMEQAKTSAADPVKMFDSISAELTVPDPALRKENFRKFLSTTPEPLHSESVREWASDTKALLDELERVAAGAAKSPLEGRLDLDRVGVFGMSYGGATAGEFCVQDPRCKAAINIDGGQYGRLIDDSLMVPLLIISSSQAYGAHFPVLDLTRGPAWLIRVPETNHIGLTDLSLQGPLFGWMGVTGKLDPRRREAIMTDYTVGFFEKYLMSRNAELFDGLAARYPEVKVESRNTP
jgi:predicted dienelactone hydrolase